MPPTVVKPVPDAELEQRIKMMRFSLGKPEENINYRTFSEILYLRKQLRKLSK